MQKSLTQHLIHLTQGKPATIAEMLLDEDTFLKESERAIDSWIEQGGSAGAAAQPIKDMYNTLNSITDPEKFAAYKQEVTAAVRAFSLKWADRKQAATDIGRGRSKEDYGHIQR